MDNTWQNCGYLSTKAINQELRTNSMDLKLNTYQEIKNFYQFPPQHHNPHHLYSQCPTTNVDHSKLQNVHSVGVDSKFEAFMPQNVGLENPLRADECTMKSSEAESTDVKNEKKKKNPRKPKAEKAVGDVRKKSDKAVDTSTFTIEERLVAAVWIHERHHTHHTIPEIMNNFLQRFGRDSPSKTTLFAWERKLFATGNACDAPRPGRPEKRKSHVSSVAASLQSAPALSLRARAQALRLPRTTLHSIMKHDLPPRDHERKPTDKQPPKRRVKQPPRKNQSPPGAAPPPAPLPPAHTHMNCVMHSHAHTHGYT